MMRSTTRSVLTPRDPLTSTTSPAPSQLVIEAAASVLVGVHDTADAGIPASTAAAAIASAGAPPTVIKRSSRAAAAARPHALVKRHRVLAELQHLAEHRSLSRRAAFVRQRLERVLERSGAGVVGVVERR